MRYRALIAVAAIVVTALAIDILGALLGTTRLITDLLAIPIGGSIIGALVAWSAGVSPLEPLTRRRRSTPPPRSTA